MRAPRTWIALAAGGLLLAASAASAQGVPVTGAVADSSGTTLPGATVTLLGEGGLLVAFASTDGAGRFRVGPAAAGAYTVQVSFVGFETARVAVEVGAAAVDVGTVTLARQEGELGQVVVEGRRGPVVVRADTLDYDAQAVGVPAGGTVEDLLARLPGVEVDADGTVRAQGEVVRRVLVDGEELFADAPTVTTRNLPADAVDRVQVFEDAGDAGFVGVDDGSGVRTLNLQLKEDRRGGAFGTAQLGAGLADDGAVADGRGSVFRFGTGTRATLLVSGNDVGRAALSFEEYVALLGGIQALAPSADGVVRLGSGLPIGDAEGRVGAGVAGAFASRTFADGTRAQASYFGVESRADQSTESVRTWATGGGPERESAEADERVSLHRASARLDAERGAVALRAGTGLTLGWTGREGSTRRSLDGGPETTAVTAADGQTARLDASAAVRRTLAGGGTLGLEADAAADWDDAALDVVGGAVPVPRLRRAQSGREGGLRATATRTFGTAARARVSLAARLARAARALDGVDATARTRTARLGLGGDAVWRGLGLSAGLDVEAAARTGAVADVDLGDAWARLLPSLTVRSADRTAEVGYRAVLRPPTLAQLDPRLEPDGGFAAAAGAPDLAPETTHLVRGFLRRFDAFSLTTTFLTARLGVTPDAISRERTSDGLARTTTLAQVGAAWTAGGSLTLSRPVDAVAGTLSLTATADLRRGTERVDGAESRYTTTALTGDAEYRNAPGPLDLRLGVEVGVRGATFETGPGRRVGVATPYLEAGLALGDGWEARTALRAARPVGADLGAADVPTWRAEIVRSFAGGRARVHALAADVLDGALDVRSLATAAYAEEVRTRGLGRYAMVRLAYDLSPVGR